MALGPNRFPTAAQNPYLKFALRLPGGVHCGNLGRNTFEGPGLNWTQLSLAKWWQIRERARFNAAGRQQLPDQAAELQQSELDL